MSPRPVHRALLRDLTTAVNAWIHERTAHRSSVRTRHVRRLSASAPGHVRALRIEARLFISDPAELRRVRATHADVERAIGRGARKWLRENPSHRHDERALGRAIRAAAKRHHRTLPEAGDIILTEIAPSLPEPHRTALVGPWRTFEDQREHLIDRLRPPRKRRSKAPA